MIDYTMKTIIILACFIDTATAHVCLISPHQRGSMSGLNAEETHDCSLLNEPCGGRPQNKPVEKIRHGATFNVTFQKNLSHFKTYPNGTSTDGYFQIGFWTDKQCKILKKVPDSDTPSLTLYSEDVTMPDGPLQVPAILQVTYVTNNSEVPGHGIFYQCSDIELF